MYKTVKHGENCLQYRILAQQEEGLVNVKCRKSPRTITAKLITVIILLIVGIIASAVLVPLVLTNDFIALTGTFQKFSVSTLRRSHSGNHVVVIAKKPYGWSALHPSVSTKLPNTSQVHLNDVKKSTLRTESPFTASELSSTIQTIKRTTMTNPQKKTSSDHRGRNEEKENLPTEATAGTRGRELKTTEVLLTTASVIQEQKSFQHKITEGIKISSTLEPVSFEIDPKWDFGSSKNFIDKLNPMANPLSVLGSLFFIVIVIIIFIVLRKTLPKNRNPNEREAAESKEDKTRLLKPPGSSDHDEE